MEKEGAGLIKQKKGIFYPVRLWLPSLLGRWTALLFILAWLILLIYAVGNFQGFSEDTMIFLFQMESWIAGLGALSGILSVLMYVLSRPFRRQLKLRWIVLSSLATFFYIVLYLLVALVWAFMEPYGGDLP